MWHNINIDEFYSTAHLMELWTPLETFLSVHHYIGSPAEMKGDVSMNYVEIKYRHPECVDNVCTIYQGLTLT